VGQLSGLKVGVVRETAAGEQRVALVPAAVGRLRAAGLHVLVEAGAGAAAWFADEAYGRAGAVVVDTDELYAGADVLLSVGRLDPAGTERLRPGQVVIGMLAALADPGYARRLADRGVTAISLDGLPRTLSRAQAMDALTSQASVAGYKAVLVAASRFGRYFPMMITAAGTERPAEVLVLGVGVAGLQAIGTARRLGAVVRAYDVRPEARQEAESVGATFLTVAAVPDGSGVDGHARELSEDETADQQRELAGQIARHDVVITTAQVPGRPAPLLVTEPTVKAMRPGSVIVDLAASDLGGNVAGSRPGQTVVSEGGVTIVGADNLPATVPAAASAGYARNVSALLLHLVVDGAVAIDLTDEILAGVVVAHGGEVVHPGVARLLAAAAAAPAAAPGAGPGADR
jgi:NAD(P) transhydrogenase subunit alpha